MGVLNCSRVGCGNIMCDIYIYSIGHVCHNCKEEFKKYLREKRIDIEGEEQLVEELKKFMETEGYYYNERTAVFVDEFFDARDSAKNIKT